MLSLFYRLPVSECVPGDHNTTCITNASICNLQKNTTLNSMNIYDDSSEKRSWFITTQHIRYVLRSNDQSLIIRGNSFSTYHTF